VCRDRAVRKLRRVLSKAALVSSLPLGRRRSADWARSRQTLSPNSRAKAVLLPIPTAAPDSTRASLAVVVAEQATESLAADDGAVEVICCRQCDPGCAEARYGSA
jgi:hypothetical protein